VIIVVFGGATLLLQDKTFIMEAYRALRSFRRDSRVACWFDRDLLAYLMKGVTLPAAVWTRLTWAWVAFFAFMGVANWYVAFHYSEQTWVLYKVWGGIGLFLVFAVAQGVWLSRYALEDGVNAMDVTMRSCARDLLRLRLPYWRFATTAPPTSAMPAPPGAAGTFPW
jgi:intracellular septation protein